MTAPAFDPRQLGECVARAIAGAAEPDGVWDELSEADRTSYMLWAHAAIEEHDACLVAAGFRILPPGVTPVPRSDEELEACRTAIKAYLQAKARKSALVGSVASKLIMPGMH